MAYEQVAGPLGGARADLHAALVASTVVNAMKGKKGKQATVKDFLPNWDRHAPAAAADPDELLAKVAGINAALGGEDLRGDDR